MQTRLYSDLFGLIQAMLGISLSVVEAIRVKALVNRRAQRAYRATNYWTRFLKIGQLRNVINSTVPFQQANLPLIDTFLRIHPFKPYVGSGSNDYEFTVTSEGAKLIVFVNDSGEAYVTYKAAIEIFYGDNVGEDQNIPYEWFQYIAYGVYADYLRAEGQQERAAIAEIEAQEILTDELMKLDEQHTQSVISQRIFTHGNMESRR
jgi:hypothetical protein